MCGIAGVIDWNERVEADAIARMLDRIGHRGPDDRGVHASGPVGLGMTRLAIIDVAGGTQPMRSPDGRYTLVFNGQIYNYVELRLELERRGVRFETRSDTEVLLQALIHDGTDALTKLNGMFAFGLWDSAEESLLLARDRLGVKPLYISAAGSRFAFASELKSLLALPWIGRDVDPHVVAEYLQLGYVRSPATLLRAITKVPPGHAVRLTRTGRQSTRYWKPDHTPAPIEAGAARERLLELLRDSIRLRQRSDVPIGAFLSGGVDSGLVVALLAEQSAAAVQTYTVRFTADGIDEGPAAREIANRYGTRHDEISVSTREALDLLPKLVWHLDEPQADTAALPTYAISKFAAGAVKVVLTGVGGDELFGGYTRYFQGTPAEHVYRMIPRSMRRALLAPAVGLASSTWGWRAALNEHADVDRLLLQSSYFSGEPIARLTGGTATHVSFSAAYDAAAAADPVNRLMGVDLVSYLPEDILHITDRMSMAVSLEAREPLLDRNLVDFMLSVPGALKVDQRRRVRKILLNEVAAAYLPAETFSRPKQGFGSPVDAWMRKGLLESTTALLRNSAAVRHGLLDRQGLDSYLTRGGAYDARQRGVRVWSLLMLELWARVFLDGNASEPSFTLHEIARA